MHARLLTHLNKATQKFTFAILPVQKPVVLNSWVWFSSQGVIWKMAVLTKMWQMFVFFNWSLKKQRRLVVHIRMHLLTRQMSWRSWCRRASGDTLDWRTESLLPCWYKLSLGYSCAVGLNIHPHLEAKTAKACKNEKQGEKLARPTPCFLVTTVWAGGALLFIGVFCFFKVWLPEMS